MNVSFVQLLKLKINKACVYHSIPAVRTSSAEKFKYGHMDADVNMLHFSWISIGREVGYLSSQTNKQLDR